MKYCGKSQANPPHSIKMTIPWTIVLLSFLICPMIKIEGQFGNLFRSCCYYVTVRNCSGQNEISHRCADCTRPTPFCGLTRCNIFGCNCEACRTSKENTKVIGMASWLLENF